MNIFINGNGNVGTALKKFLKKQSIAFFNYEKKMLKDGDIVFLAVSDDIVEYFVDEIVKTANCNTFHFAGSKQNLIGSTLIHPFASISKESDLSKILFTLFVSENQNAENILKNIGIKFIKSKKTSVGYHTSAVFSGNFVQFFYLLAQELLKKEGFSNSDSNLLIKQLIDTSLENVLKNGFDGLTGPAKREDFKTIEREKRFLNELSEDYAKIYELISETISKIGKNDDLFKK